VIQGDSVLRSYKPDANDQDDDYLPDDWEAQYGLSLTDNGLVDRAREGERGDFDRDGLTNHEEYLLSTRLNRHSDLYKKKRDEISLGWPSDTS